MDSKEILLAYINTLNDKECKSIYLMLKELEGNKGKYEMYTPEGIISDDGFIKLTPKQFHNLKYSWGEEKLVECLKILAKLLEGGKKVRASHYNLLKGYAETQYNLSHKKKGKPVSQTIDIKFDEVQSKAQARLYVSKIPEYLRSEDVYVMYLVNRWGEDIL
jgi:hypothetical protein